MDGSLRATVVSQLSMCCTERVARWSVVWRGAEGGSWPGVLIWCMVVHTYREEAMKPSWIGRSQRGKLGYAFSVKCRGGIDEAFCPRRTPSVSGLSPCRSDPSVIVHPRLPPPCPPPSPTINPSLPTYPARGPVVLATTRTTPFRMQTSLPSSRMAPQSTGLARTRAGRPAGDGRIQVLSARMALVQSPLPD